MVVDGGMPLTEVEKTEICWGMSRNQESCLYMLRCWLDTQKWLPRSHHHKAHIHTEAFCPLSELFFLFCAQIKWSWYSSFLTTTEKNDISLSWAPDPIYQIAYMKNVHLTCSKLYLLSSSLHLFLLYFFILFDNTFVNPMTPAYSLTLLSPHATIQ